MASQTRAKSRETQPRSDSRAARSEARATKAKNRARWGRHLTLAVVSGLLVWLFWLTRAKWTPDMRLWKAAGDASYVLLLAALVLGPLTRLVPSTRSWLKWRRQIGIWFALTATLHGVLILNGWTQWSLRRFLGYEFIPQLGYEARIEPGFGLANIIGVAALFLALVLAATSSDRALSFLGRPAWTWLQRLAQTVLILSLLHGSYFLFVHYTLSFHKMPPGLDWFRVPFLLAGLSVLALEAAAFVATAVKGDKDLTSSSGGKSRRR